MCPCKKWVMQTARGEAGEEDAAAIEIQGVETWPYAEPDSHLNLGFGGQEETCPVAILQ